MKDSNKILFKGAVMNCGIATAIINGIICFFTLTKANALLSSDLAFNFLSTAIGCGVICPFFGGLILKGVAAKNEIDFGSKSEQTIAKFIPNNIVLGAIIIGLITVLTLWILPYAVIKLTSLQLTLSRIVWIVIIALYSGLAASIAAYFGMKRAHYAK
ncbi:MAG: hypothetical protein DBX41_04605 [Clostridiales bacterium]|nr:MAG: hypothetical protein DBX41_04605 [Clostridiales bacterium]